MEWKEVGIAVVVVASIFIVVIIIDPFAIVKLAIIFTIAFLVTIMMLVCIDLNELSNDIKTERVRIDATSTMEKIDNRKVTVVTWSCPECSYDLHVHYVKPGNGELQQFKDIVADHLVTCHHGDGNFPFFTIRMRIAT